MELSYSIGLKLGIPIHRRLSGEIGFQYSQINSIIMVDSGSFNVHNHYNGNDIPALLGYRLRDNQFNTTIDAGIIFNAYSWYHGMIFENYQVVNIGTGNVYKEHTSLSLYLGMNLVKQVCDNLLIFT